MDERLLESEATDAGGLPWRVYEESKKLWKITFPAILSRVTAFGIFVVTQAFVGHLGSIELAAYAVMQILGVRLVFGILIGMSSATETLCGQAYGARQYHMLGIYLQRSWIVNFITATVFLPVFFLGTPILKLLKENDEIAEAAGQLGPWFVPMLYAMAFSLTLQQYLQCQLKNQIIAWLSTAFFVVHLLLSWLSVSVLNWGVHGAMGAMNISMWSMLIGQLIYVFGGWCPDTWTGFTFAAFSDLWPVVKLSVSSGVMLCLEMWYNAILVLLAGYMRNASVAISAFSIWFLAEVPLVCFSLYCLGFQIHSSVSTFLSLNISAWEFMICLGFLVGVSVRVSNELGRGNAKAAHFSVKVVLVSSIVIGVILWILCLFFGRELAYVFTSDEDVVETVSSLSVLLAFTILLNSIQPVFSGVAVGCGRQGMVAWVNIGSYYVIGIPLGVVLGYVANLDVQGIWIGMIIGVAIQTLVLGTIIWRTNWDAQVEKAAERLSKWFLQKKKLEDDEPEDSAQEAPNGR